MRLTLPALDAALIFFYKTVIGIINLFFSKYDRLYVIICLYICLIITN